MARATGQRWYAQREAMRQRVQAGEPCGRCGQPIDLSLKHTRWRKEPMALTIGHILEVCMGGTEDESNLRPEHHVCNVGAENASRRGLRRGQRRPGMKAPKPQPDTTRDWFSSSR